jgi:serine/threonine protein kinase
VLSCLKHAADRQVYRMSDRVSGAQFVLKLAPSAEIGALRREHDLLRRLHDEAFPHPGACFEWGGSACLMREYVPGRSLSEQVEDSGPFPEARTVEIARKVCEIVRRLHHGTPPVVHRDIKPQNLILAPDGAMRLVDLDAAQELSAEKTEDTVVMGSAATAAPEQFGYRRCDARTDVYAIGMLLIFLLTGGYSRAGLDGAPASRGLKRTIARCIRFDPLRRFKSVDQLARRLRIRMIRHRGILRPESPRLWRRSGT